MSHPIPDPPVNLVSVRWWDGYLEEFEASEVRFGSDLLWMRLAEGGNRHIPLRGVRWFSLSKESHGLLPPARVTGAVA